jgi:hypothetical protein
MFPSLGPYLVVGEIREKMKLAEVMVVMTQKRWMIDQEMFTAFGEMGDKIR